MPAYVSQGVTVAFTGDDSGTLTAQLVDITVDATKTDQVDVTYQGTTNQIRDFISGLHDGQSVTLLLNFDPDNVRPALGEAGDLVFSFGAWAGTTLNTLTIPCNVEELGDIQATLGDKVTESIKFKVTGAKAWSTV